MSDLISREAVINIIHKEIEEVTDYLQHDVLIDVEFEVDELPTVESPTWILCSERLPEKLEAVNITWVNRKPEPYYAHIKDKPFVATGYYWNKKWWWYSNVCEEFLGEYGESGPDVMDADIEVIAWMPLPSAFAGE